MAAQGQFVGAIDQGTTSTRFMIFDHSGNVKGVHQLEHEQILPQAGWVEHDATEIWERTQDVIRDGLRAARIEATDLAAIGATAYSNPLPHVLMLTAIVAAALIVPAGLLIRRAPEALAAAASPATDVAPQQPRPSGAAAALRTPQFVVLAATFFLCCAAHSGPIFHTVSYAMICGASALAAASIYSVEGLAGLFGRLLFGVAAVGMVVFNLAVLGTVVSDRAFRQSDASEGTSILDLGPGWRGVISGMRPR